MMFRRLILSLILIVFATICLISCRNLVPPGQVTPSPDVPTPTRSDLPTPTDETHAAVIVFESNRTGDWDIYRMNPDGTHIVNLTHSATSEGDAAWSPDGKLIAFESDRDGNLEIYTMDGSDGQHLVRLTYWPDVDEDPSWSPDSQYIAFTSLRDGNREIYVAMADGTRPAQRLTIDCARDEFPVWSSGEVTMPSVLAAPATRLISIKGEQRANLRNGPATTFEAVSDAAPGECLTAIGRSRDSSWLQVRTYQGKELWVAVYLTDVQGDLSSIPVTEARG